jgi:hypothetical protein
VLSTPTIRTLIGAAILVHGIAHSIALAGLLAQCLTGTSSGRVTIHSWLLPRTRPQGSAAAAIPFWFLSTLAFIAASLSVWGLILPPALWRGIATGGAIMSILAILAFSLTWPGSPNRQRSMLNTGVAAIMDLAILITQLWLHWPLQAVFGW